MSPRPERADLNQALASYLLEPTPERALPDPLDKRVALTSPPPSPPRRQRPTARCWNRITACCALLTLQGWLATSAAAQPVGAGSGPLSDVSVPVSEGSRPVHEYGRTMREASVGPMRSGPVRQDTTGSMRSGPLSEISRGAVTSNRPMSGGGSMAEHSAGAVKNELRPSAGERVYDLERALAPLQAQLHRAEDAAGIESVDAADEPPQPADEFEEGGAELKEETAIEKEVTVGEPLETEGDGAP